MLIFNENVQTKLTERPKNIQDYKSVKEKMIKRMANIILID